MNIDELMLCAMNVDRRYIDDSRAVLCKLKKVTEEKDHFIAKEPSSFILHVELFVIELKL